MVNQEAERRREILDAVARCVVEEGIDGATIRRIAQELNASTGLLTHYFANKKELIQATLTAATSRREESLSRRDPIPPGMPRLNAAFEFVFDKRDPALPPWAFWVQYWAAATHDQDIREIYAGRIQRFGEEVREYLREAMAAGEVSPGLDIDGAAELLLAVYYGLGLRTALEPEKMTHADAMDVSRLAFEVLSAFPGRNANQPRRRYRRRNR